MLSDLYRNKFYGVPGLVKDEFDRCTDNRTLRAARPWFAPDAPDGGKVGIHWPACAPDYQPGDPLFVGRSGNGWDVKFGLADSPEVIEKRISESRKWSQSANWREDVRCTRTARFWQAVGALRPLEGGSSLPRRFAWSNLAKISPARGGNPQAWMLRWQLDRAGELLRMETEQLRPGLVVCITGDWCKAFWPEPWPQPRTNGPVLRATGDGCVPPWICVARPDQRPPRWPLTTWAEAVKLKARELGFTL